MRQWVGVESRDGRGVGRILGDRLHVGGDLAGFDGGHLPEIRACDFAELEGKLIVLEAREPVGEMVDRVVRDRQRTVAARVFHFQLIIGVKFFRGIDGHHCGLALARVDAATIRVEHEFGVDQIAMVAQEPVDAVRTAGFFVGG